jgi:tRNA nucleotidyltransferase/poly(A) polymerase
VQRRDNIQIVARSRLPAVNIGKLMQGLGGGGHASAASAAVRNARLPDLEQVVLDSLRRNIKATLTARSIMTTAVKTLPAAKPVAEARELLEQQGIGTIPVVENNKLIGMVSRHDLDHALRSGYGHSPVKGYLHCPAITATLQTSIQELEKIIIENNIGVIPVLSRGKLVGVVSRTDVFNATHHHLLGGGGIPKGPSPQRKPKNLRKLLKDVLRGRIYRLLKTISAHAESRQVRAYLVGGCVRDLLLGRKNFDLDIVVETNGIEYAPDLARVVKGTVRLHRRFKTAKITLADGLVIDVATARTESYEYPAALPVVASSSLRIDLSRRDFTINTLALGLNRKNFGDLLDFFDAEKDLRDKRIRVLHDLSFIEDPTRILRAVRFEQRFDFFIDRHTENLIRAAVDLNMFGRLHTFRIGDELRLILSEPDPLKVIRRMGQLHELKFIHPTLKFNRSMAELLDAVDTGLGWYERTFREKTGVILAGVFTGDPRYAAAAGNTYRF